MKQIVIPAIVLAFSVGASAAQDKTANITQVENIEVLNDDLNKFSGKRVQVSGEVNEKIDSRSVILESGGFFNNDIVVIAGPNMKGNLASLREDAHVKVTGTVVVKPLTDVSREYAWDLTPDIQTQLRNAKAFIVAEEVTTSK